jgi:UDP-N-acetylglucosamine acyltransferase
MTLSPQAHVHPSAVIETGAMIGAGCVIGPFSVIGPEVTLHPGVTVKSHAVVTGWTEIGEGTVIFPFATVGEVPQDLKFRGEPTWLVMGDYNQVREHVTIHRGTGNGGGYTRVGNHNLFMVNVHIAHDCVIGNHTIMANNVMLAGHVHVEDHANLGGAVGIHHFARVGYCSFVGAMARVPKDVPPFMLVEGSPSSVRSFNQIGMSRLGLPEEEIEAAKEAYKKLFRLKGGSIVAKAQALRQQFPGSKVIARICDAVAQAGDGVYGRAMETKRGDDKRARR